MQVAYHTPLSAAEQNAFGITQPAPLAMADQVRMSELDVLNHANNAVYMTWFERLRVKYTQLYGLSRHGDFRAVPGKAPRIVIRSGTIHYREEMRMDEDYAVTCRCDAFRRTSFTLSQQIWADGRQRATLDCVIVLLNADGGGRFEIPDPVKARFLQEDGATDETPG